MTGSRATIQTEKMLWWTSSSFLSSAVVAKVCFDLNKFYLGVLDTANF